MPRYNYCSTAVGGQRGRDIEREKEGEREREAVPKVIYLS